MTTVNEVCTVDGVQYVLSAWFSGGRWFAQCRVEGEGASIFAEGSTVEDAVASLQGRLRAKTIRYNNARVAVGKMLARGRK